MFRQLILSGALGASLFLSACGGGGGSPAPVVTPPAPSNTVSGSAAKGIIVNGKVSAYAIRNKAIDRSKAIASTSTATDGTYSLNISNYNGPVSVEITTQANTTMLCDVPIGCQITAGGTITTFGQPVPLTDANFKLRAFIPRVDKAISASITPLTHMAAQYAESLLASSDAATAIDQANSRVANLFKLDGDLLALTPPDITKSSNTASKQENRYAVLAAAFANVAQSIDKLGETIDKAANNFSAHNGQLTMVDRDNSLGEITLANITNAAVAVTSSAAADSKLSSAIRSSVDEILFLSSLANEAAEDSASSASSSVTSGKEELAKVKALIGDIRALASVGQNYLTLAGKIELFLLQRKLNIAESALKNSEGSLKAIKKASLLAIEFAKGIQVSSPDKSSTLLNVFNTSSALQSSLPLTSISDTSVITYSAATRKLSLSGVIDSVTMALSIEMFNGNTGTEFPVTITGQATDGTSGIAIDSLTVTPRLYASKTINTSGIQQPSDINISDIRSLELNFVGAIGTIQTAQNPNTVVFRGGINITYITSNHLLEVNPGGPRYHIYALQHASLGGRLQLENEYVFAALSFTNSNAALAIPTVKQGQVIIGQFSDPFATGGAIFTTELDMNALGKTKLEVKTTRTGLKTAAAQVSFENTTNNIGRKIVFSATGDFNSETITGLKISNQDSVQLTIEQLSPVTANLKLNGTQYATISQVGSGLIKVTYSDGTFESFN